MRQIFTRMSIGAAISLCGAPALAADQGFYISAGLGLAEEDPGKSNGINVSFGLPPVGILHLEPDSVEVDSGDVAWSIGVGYRFSRHIAAEVEYQDLGTTEYTEHYTFDSPFPVDSGQITHAYSSSMTGLSVSALGSLPMGKAFAFFLRGGALFVDREVHIPRAVGSGDHTFADTVWLGGAGVDWNPADRWALRAEYQRTGEFGSTLSAGEATAEAFSLRVRFSF
jgi:opacity protein-like surface antigen